MDAAPSSTASRRDRARASLEDRLARPAPTVWLSGQEAAEYVGVSWPTLRQTIVEHRIPHVRLGTRWRIDVALLARPAPAAAGGHGRRGCDLTAAAHGDGRRTACPWRATPDPAGHPRPARAWSIVAAAGAEEDSSMWA